MSVRFAAIICLSIISPFANGNIMGDGVFMDADGKISLEDDRRFCNESDLTCKSSGSLWCESEKGHLLFSGSAVAISSEITWDSDEKAFVLSRWKKLATGRIRFISAGHNFYQKVFKSDSGNKYPYYEEYFGDCFFYPTGNEPIRKIERQRVHYRYLKKHFRPNEGELRMKVIQKTSPWEPSNTLGGSLNLPDEWTWGILDGDAGVEGAAILNVSRAVLKKLAEGRAQTKQYGYNTYWLTTTVAADETKLFLSQPSYLNHNMPNVILDCQDSNGGVSGGASTIDVEITGKRYEAVYGVRSANVWYKYAWGPEGAGHGEICKPESNANAATGVSGPLYESLKASF